MTFTAQQLTDLIAAYLWPFCRIAAAVGVAPIFGARSVPVKVRLLMVVALTAAVAPTAPSPHGIDPVSVAGFLVTAQQVLIGLAMGFAVSLVFSAFILGGQVFAMQMGLGFAALVDPQRGVQVPMVSQFYVLAATLVFLSINGHLVLIQVLAESFRSMPIGTTGLSDAGMWGLVAWGSQMFAGGVAITLPAITTLMLVNLAFGVMTRAAPQLHIFAVGFPVSLTVGFVVMLLMLPALGTQLVQLSDSVFTLLRGITAGGG